MPVYSMCAAWVCSEASRQPSTYKNVFLFPLSSSRLTKMKTAQQRQEEKQMSLPTMPKEDMRGQKVGEEEV